MAFDQYLKDVKKKLWTGVAREHAYRPVLKTLLQSLESGILATNEPRRTSAGAPDCVVACGGVRRATSKPGNSVAACERPSVPSS